MQQEGTNNDRPQIMPEPPRAGGYQGDSTFETDSSILNCTVLNSGVSNDTGVEFDGENYKNYLLALMQCEEPGMNALNWVVGTPAPIHRPISPAQTSSHHRQRIPVFATPIQSTEQKSSPKRTGDTSNKPAGQVLLDHAEINSCCSSYRKPNCSYTCLIGMALQASKNGCLPVNEIYKFIEREYPFFRTAPEGWKNSVRHSLSLNQCFRKVERTDGWQGKKGYFWEINPERKGTVEREIDKWLKEEGRHLTQNPNGLCAPLDLPFSNAFPVSLQARVPVMPSYHSPHRSSVTGALGLTGQCHTPQQLAQLQHFAQQLQQECAERMALLQSPSISSPDHSFACPGNSALLDGSTSSSGGAGSSSRILFNADEPPSHYMTSLECSNSNLEDLPSSLFGGLDGSNLEDAESTFHSFILSDDVTFQSDADQAVAMSPAVEVEVEAVCSGSDPSPPTTGMSTSTSHISSTSLYGLCSAQGADELSHGQMTSTPLRVIDLKDVGEEGSKPCSSRSVLTIKKGGTRRPCACKRLFGSKHQSTGDKVKEEEEEEGDDAMSDLCAHLKSLRKHVTPKRLHRQSGHSTMPWLSPRHGASRGAIMGEMAAIGEETEVAPWGESRFPIKVSITLNKLETESSLQPMQIDKPSQGSNSNALRCLIETDATAQLNNTLRLYDVFHDSCDLSQIYWNDSDITNPPFDGLTEEELKELQKDLFSEDFSVLLNGGGPSRSIEKEEENGGDGVSAQEQSGCVKSLSGDVLLNEYAPLMDANSSSTIEDVLDMSKGFGCEHAVDNDVKVIKKIADELQRGTASCEQTTSNEALPSI